LNEMLDLAGRIRATLGDLVALHGAPGFEADVVKHVKARLEKVSDEVEVDRNGNLYALRRGGDGPSLMLAAHSDEVGFIVKSVEREGFLRFERLGGTQASALPAQRVVVGGCGGVPGVIGTRSSHFVKEGTGGSVTPVEDHYIDVGAKSADEVARLDISIGDPVTFAPNITDGPAGRVTSKALDDRLGLTVMIELLEEIRGLKPAGDVWAVATVQEEIGLRGAVTATYKVRPSYALSIDTIAASDAPDSVPTREIPVSIGRGPVLVMAMGGRGIAQVSHPRVKRFLWRAAEKAGVDAQLATMVGFGATDAAAMQISRQGVPCAGVSLPRRYSHSPVETADLNDAVGAVRLLKAFIEDMGGHGDLGFVE